MASGKKSFVAYADWKNTFDELPDEVAGKLIKHIFSYVNDENPNADYVINAIFANIKNTLKRDLQKWERQLEQRSEAGKASAEARRTKINERSTSVNENVRNPTDSVSVSVNVSDILLEKETKENADANSTRHTSYMNQCLSEKSWREVLYIQKVVTINNIEPAIKAYNNHLIAQGENKNTLKDYKSHFVNWMNKRNAYKAKNTDKPKSLNL